MTDKINLFNLIIYKVEEKGSLEGNLSLERPRDLLILLLTVIKTDNGNIIGS